jgi:hypothetical protein
MIVTAKKLDRILSQSNPFRISLPYFSKLYLGCDTI